MKKIRIAAGAGYSGDRIEPALDIIQRGNVDYIIFECLAERTIALAQKDKVENPDRGYNPLLEYRMEKIFPLLKKFPVKIVTNMGAANPRAAAEKIQEIAQKCGCGNIKIAAVEGDNVLADIEKYYDFPIMETGEKLGGIAENIVSANAYMGSKAISKALAQGADIVVTGRVADPSLVSGALMYEFGKAYDDYDFLGKCIVAGHLLECGGQVTGGYFADPGKKDVPDLWDLGFPIMVFDESGDMLLEKLPNTGGLINEETVKEQLLYEIQDPANYLTPDVIADFTGIRVKSVGESKVAVSGATGRAPTGTLKVSVGYWDGWIGEGEISYGGYNAQARAELAGEIIRKRLELLEYACRELRIDVLGVNSLYRDAIKAPADPIELRLRISARVDTEEQAEIIGREVEALYTNGPAGGGGARGYTRKVMSVVSYLIPRDVVQAQIHWKGGGNA